MPGDADHDQVRADLVDGVLTVRLTKSGSTRRAPLPSGRRPHG
ncbi:Hsp20/alpha crystallin family protein [Actinomadura keratinilytica]